MLDGKSILITGGTGSFGKKFIKTILETHTEIERIVIYSRDEFKQFMMSNMPEFKKHADKLRFLSATFGTKNDCTVRWKALILSSTPPH